MSDWLIYGANGYTGELVARLAVTRGERPILAGRNASAIAALAAELGLEHRVADLADPVAVRAALAGVRAIAHCAGPFAATSASVVDACISEGVHYLDITGEIEVFEAVFARHDEAADRGVVLLPGAGFDVVPTDCLAARLHAALPTATSLELAFRVGGGPSRGTALTGLAGTAAGNRVRRNGELVTSPAGSPRRTVPLPSGERAVGAIRWGDLVTAYRSTGIPNITTYMALPASGLPGVSSLLSFRPLRSLASWVVRSRMSGPDAALRARTKSEVWGEVRDGAGRSATATLTGPNPYDMTADSVVRAVRLLVDGSVEPGAHTPSSAFGSGYAETLDGVTVI